jgi:hypothetical protein
MYLGDLIELGTKKTGIHTVVKKATKGRCGCSKRKEKLNNADKNVRDWVKNKF